MIYVNRVTVYFVDGPAAGRFETMPVGDDGEPEKERWFQPGALYVGASDEPVEPPPPVRYVRQTLPDDPLADWAYVYAP